MAKKELKIGSKVKVQASNFSGEGFVGEAPLSLRERVLKLKLKSGYDVGISRDKIKSIKQLGSEKVGKAGGFGRVVDKVSSKGIALVATGGTISNRVDYRTGAVSPIMEPKEFLGLVPELGNFANIRKLYRPFTIASEELTFKDYEKLCEAVYDAFNSKDGKKLYGLVVTHGTDVLHFTSAALSFALRGLDRPIAVTGAQRSSDRASFDGAQNLICSSIYATSEIAEVATVLHGSSNDDYCLAIRGTRSRKMHTSRRDAFRPINDLPLAKIWPDGRIENIGQFKKKGEIKEKFVLRNKFSDKVGFIHFVPSMGPELLDFYLDKGYEGVIVCGTGLGHVAVQTADKKKSWLEAFERARQKRVFVGMVGQNYGRVHTNVYTNLRLIAEKGVTYLEDMAYEAAYMKLSWVLGQTKNLEEVKKMMLTNYAGELKERSFEGEFLY